MSYFIENLRFNRKNPILIIFVLIILIASILTVKYFSESSDTTYFDLCLRGTSENLKQSMDKYGWSANKIFNVKLNEDKYNELSDYFLDRWGYGKIKFTPIILAAGNKDVNVLKLLIERGAIVTENALSRALLNWMTDNNLILLKIIIDEKISIGWNDIDVAYSTVTFFVRNKIEGDNKTILQYLIDCGAFASNNKEIFLDAARRVSDPEFYIMLEKNGIDFKKYATQLLEEAAIEGRMATTKLFLERGGDPNTTVRRFRTTGGPNPEYIYMPLIVRAAEWNAGTDVLAALLEAGADPNAQDSDGMTALMRLDQRIHDAHAELMQLGTDANKTLYFYEDHKFAEPGSQKRRDLVVEHQEGQQRWIKDLEARRAVLIEAGAKM